MEAESSGPARPVIPIVHEPSTGRIRPYPPAVNQNRICPSIAFLEDHLYPRRFLEMATLHAAQNGTTGACEAVAHGLIGEEIYFRTLAGHLGREYIPANRIVDVLAGDGEPSEDLPNRTSAWCRLSDGRVRRIFAPAKCDILRALAAADGSDRAWRCVTHPAALRGAILRRGQTELGVRTTHSLAVHRPELSAKYGAGTWHGFILAGLLAILLAGLAVSPGRAWLTLHLAFTLFFLACIALRLAAAFAFRREPEMALSTFSNRERPVYTVMVALNREAPVVPDLIASLKLLRWPRTKLEIKLICEADDEETRTALAGETLDSRFEIIYVPIIGPRTKPKALSYALPLCSGSLLTLYDAEDRPDPAQLEEAWQRFRAAGDDLAALQAPLIMANPRRNVLTAMFHLEYAALFQGILQWLVRRGLPVPLGGTSTHFRRSAVESVGGWDPYNVTEDADLGFRLWQDGYTVGRLSRPTWEDAPDTVMVWLRQRTRWIKGWMQTWIVQSRRNGRALARGRLRGFAVMQVLLAGTVMCALFYPFTVVTAATLAVWRLSGANPGAPPGALELLDWSNIVLSLSAYAFLCLRTAHSGIRPHPLRSLWATPVYWLLMSAAGWRAVLQIFTNPFLWEKTPHKAHDEKNARPSRRAKSLSRDAGDKVTS